MVFRGGISSRFILQPIMHHLSICLPVIFVLVRKIYVFDVTIKTELQVGICHFSSCQRRGKKEINDTVSYRSLSLNYQSFYWPQGNLS